MTSALPALASPKQRGLRVLAWVAIGFMALVWGSTWLVIRVGLRDLPPFTGLLLRFLVALAAFVPLAHLLTAKEGGARPPFWLAAVMGTFNFTGSYCIVYWVEQWIPSSLASLLFATYPLLLAAGAHAFLPGERLSRVQSIGFVIGFAGVAMLLGCDVPALGRDALLASLVMMLSPVVVAIGTIAVKRRGAGFSSLLLNRDALAISVLQIGIVWFLTERDATVRFTAEAVFSVLYLALLGTVATFGLYFWLLRTVPAKQLALVAYLTPAIAVLLGQLLLDEPVTAFTIGGAASILIGVGLASRKGASQPAKESAPGSTP